MILTLNEALNYLKLEQEDLPKAELEEIQGLIKSAEMYLKNATGIDFSSRNALARLFCRMLVCDWYEDRGSVGTAKGGAGSILMQLKYCKFK